MAGYLKVAAHSAMVFYKHKYLTQFFPTLGSGVGISFGFCYYPTTAYFDITNLSVLPTGVQLVFLF